MGIWQSHKSIVLWLCHKTVYTYNPSFISPLGNMGIWQSHKSIVLWLCHKTVYTYNPSFISPPQYGVAHLPFKIYKYKEA
jgi:hypothetical protein